MNKCWAEVSISLRETRGHTHLSKRAGGTSGRRGSQTSMVVLDADTQVIILPCSMGDGMFRDN